jgi:trans-2,3-dihydro-3-hydroxyanthranilate isomerase
MRRRYVTLDVFTDRVFGGNPLAVVLDAEALSTVQMQAVASEFGYSETTFVQPARTAGHDAWVRIFTPKSELPFAGHPNVGTAFLLARIAANAPERLVFEEAAGSVVVRLLEGGAEVRAPQALHCGANLDVAAAAACLGLAEDAIVTLRHAPVVAGVGTVFVFVEVADRNALGRAAGVLAAHRAMLPLDGASGIYAYAREGETIWARMFDPLDGIVEDPATGSAGAAVVALLASLEGRERMALRIHQGEDMGRPSLLLARAEREGGGMFGFVGGRCVAVMEGSFDLAGDDAP